MEGPAAADPAGAAAANGFLAANAGAGAAGTQQESPDGGAQGKPKGEGEVIDAEVVDDDKKKS